MNMGMVLELPSPSVEDTSEARFTTIVLSGNNIFECLSTGLDDDLIELLRVLFTEASKLRRDGKCYHEVRHW